VVRHIGLELFDQMDGRSADQSPSFKRRRAGAPHPGAPARRSAKRLAAPTERDELA